jgi:hypothetical protein
MILRDAWQRFEAKVDQIGDLIAVERAREPELAYRGRYVGPSRTRRSFVGPLLALVALGFQVFSALIDAERATGR